MVNSFNKPIIPHNDKDRLNALQSFRILDSKQEFYFDNLAQIIARVFNVPIALISLVDENRVFFKANAGMSDFQNVPRGISLCSLAILENQPLIFTDALEDPCLLANPLVAGEFGLRFYAGSPLTTPDGFNIGTVCVIDKQPRNFSKEEENLLTKFAEITMQAILERTNNPENLLSP